MNQKAASSTTFECFLHHVDHFSTFQIGHPENPNINDFDMFSTFQIGHPEIPKIHNFDIF